MMRRRYLSGLTLVVGLLPLLGRAEGAAIEIAATRTQIVLRWEDRPPGPVLVREAAVFETDAEAAARPPVWSGVPDANAIRMWRFDGPADRLYRRFRVSGAAGDAVAFVTDVSSLPVTAATPPRPESYKGLQCIVDLDDAIALGVRHTAVNVSFDQLYDPTGRSPIRRDVDGVPVAAREDTLRTLDASVAGMSRAGMRVNLILLNRVPPAGQPRGPLVHPRTGPKPVNGMGAFNLANLDGYRVYRGLVEILAERYSRADAQYGLVAGYNVGNEVQSHGDWYDLGDADPATVAAEYAKALRVADLAVRRFQPDARVFASFDHNWAAKEPLPPTRAMPGRELLDRLRATTAAQGDFPWAVAFHPYADDLANPRTWLDADAVLSFETPRVTFRNLEVLTEYLGRPEMLHRGRRRRILLSEQGFNAPQTADGELLQATAYAYAYERVMRLGGIEAFIYHRHVDHAGEGGLRLGLRANVPGTLEQPGRPKRIYEVFRAADGPDREAAFAFAKPIIGLRDWSEVGPALAAP